MKAQEKMDAMNLQLDARHSSMYRGINNY